MKYKTCSYFIFEYFVLKECFQRNDCSSPSVIYLRSGAFYCPDLRASERNLAVSLERKLSHQTIQLSFRVVIRPRWGFYGSCTFSTLHNLNQRLCVTLTPTGGVASVVLHLFKVVFIHPFLIVFVDGKCNCTTISTFMYAGFFFDRELVPRF